jgi:B9 domain-containing protein 2
VIGELVGASEFPSGDLFCKWSVSHGSGWRVLEGAREGQTQTDHPQDGSFSKWSHPIDLHFGTKGLQGWPKLSFQVFHEDFFGRRELYGYGFVTVPTTPGIHDISCVTWRPVGSHRQQFSSFFLGGSPELTSDSLIHSCHDRQHLRTQAMGRVHLRLMIILRHLSQFGVEVS